VFDFRQLVCDVAQELLEATIKIGGVAIRLTETEAYAGVDDPAAHAVRGRRPTTEALFGPPGTLYCYLSYGVHICANLVCEAEAGGSAVLLRAGDVIEGIELARHRRSSGQAKLIPDAQLARGPGNLGLALGLSLQHSGWQAGQDFEVVPRLSVPEITCGPRVGVSVANAREWRYWITGAASVSSYSRSPRAVPNSW
jgi:DNA-3-methyladenine glycosylase